MELTGKAKEDFKKWLGSDPEHNRSFFVAASNEGNYDSTLKDLFDDSFTGIEIPFSMQWGVFVDFFDNVGINIEIGIDYTSEPKYCYKINGGNWSWLRLHRKDIRLDVIEVACEIYNSNL